MGIRFTHQTPTQQVVTCLGFGEQRVNYTVTGNRIDGHSLLHQTKEKLASTLGSPTIESERELVEIVAQMLMTDGPLVRAQQPSFEQGGYGGGRAASTRMRSSSSP